MTDTTTTTTTAAAAGRVQRRSDGYRPWRPAPSPAAPSPEPPGSTPTAGFPHGAFRAGPAGSGDWRSERVRPGMLGAPRWLDAASGDPLLEQLAAGTDPAGTDPAGTDSADDPLLAQLALADSEERWEWQPARI